MRVGKHRVFVLKSGRCDADPRHDAKTAQDIEALMSKHDPILRFASRLLPADTTRDASALYAWCRRLDEITDDPGAAPSEVRRRLTEWERR